MKNDQKFGRDSNSSLKLVTFNSLMLESKRPLNEPLVIAAPFLIRLLKCLGKMPTQVQYIAKSIKKLSVLLLAPLVRRGNSDVCNIRSRR